jgi:hypothetical protein
MIGKRCRVFSGADEHANTSVSSRLAIVACFGRELKAHHLPETLNLADAQELKNYATANLNCFIMLDIDSVDKRQDT